MRKRENNTFKIIYVIIFLILFVGFFSTIFALLNTTNSNIIRNVKINNIEVANLTKQEAEEELNQKVNSIMEDKITLRHGEYEKVITLEQMELKVSANDAVYEACKVGRSKNIFINNYEILKVWLFGKNIDLKLSFNNEIVKSIYSNLDDEWQDSFIDNSYYIDDDKLIITRGKKGVLIDEETLQEEIENTIYQKIEGKEINEIEIPTKTKEPEEIDLERIRSEIYKKPQDASYNEETKVLKTHVNGVDFKITIDEAKEILKEEKEEYEIPLEITKPDITTEKLGEEAFPNKLATFSTRYDASNTNRSTNIELSANEINDLVLLPGETFSFNGVVGPRTKAKGYKLAGAYSAGELVESYGGGICQVSSTLYNTVLYANLEIVQRYNHSSVVSYVNAGRDATVSYGGKDFKFKNSRDFAIKIKAKAQNGILTMEIWGIPQEDDVEVEITSEVTDVIIRETKYVYDSSLKKGEEVVKTIGADGAKSIAYKIIKKNNRIISKTVLSEDNYNPMTKVILTGTKK